MGVGGFGLRFGFGLEQEMTGVVGPDEDHYSADNTTITSDTDEITADAT